jgi:3-deoxy-D-manno-octulosonic-acid transferase
MGEMYAYYAACDVAIVGGSLLPYGAQNLVEACAVGRPVIVGPHTYNFAEAARLAVEAGAAVQIADARAAMNAACALLQDAPRMRRMGESGLELTSRHRGATARVMDLIERSTGAARIKTPTAAKNAGRR